VEIKGCEIQHPNPNGVTYLTSWSSFALFSVTKQR